MSLLAAIQRGLGLPGAERSGFLRAYAALAVTDLSLRLWGFQRVVERVAPVSPVAAGLNLASIDVEQVNRYVRWIKSAARRHVVNARCLHESLTLHRWLRRDGLPSELQIGVRLEDGELKAHAWVELFDQVVNDAPSHVAEFRPLSHLHGQAVIWSKAVPQLQPSSSGRP